MVEICGGMVPLASFWLRLWLQEKSEKERTVLIVLDVQSSTDKTLATTQDHQTL